MAIDGKTLRHSFDEGHAAIHVVSAWSSEHELVLGQEKVNDKSNEIKAVPKLLDLLALSGALVTIDAIGCQKDIAKKIRDKEADYILALKENQPTLFNDVTLFLNKQVQVVRFQLLKVGMPVMVELSSGSALSVPMSNGSSPYIQPGRT